MPSFGGGGAGGGGGGAPSPLDSPPTAIGVTVGATDDAAAQYAALEADIATFVTALPLDNTAIAPFTFATPPAWLVSAAAYGCRDLADVAKLTSLEHQGPIDALEQPSSVKIGDATTAASAKFDGRLPAGQLLRSQTPTTALARWTAATVVVVHVVAVIIEM